MNTLWIVPQPADGDGKVIAFALAFVPAVAAGKWDRSFGTATLAYEPPEGSETYPPL